MKMNEEMNEQIPIALLWYYHQQQQLQQQLQVQHQLQAQYLREMYVLVV